MGKTLTLFMLAILTLPCFAQDIHVQVTKSNIFKDEYADSYIQLVQADNKGGVTIVRSYVGSIFSNAFGYYFEHYDANLKLLKEFDYPIKYFQAIRQSSILGVIMDGDTVRLIEFVYNLDEKAYICSALSADINEFNFTKQELFRLNSNEIKGFAFFSGFSSSDDATASNSGASMIVNEHRDAFAITVGIKDNEAEIRRVFLFNNKLEKKIEHTFKRDIKPWKFKFENIDVSQDGNTLYLLAKAYTEEKKKKKDGGEYQFELTSITAGSEKTQVFDTEEHFCRSLKTVIFQDRLVCIGFFSDRNDKRFKGISYFELDPMTLDIRKSKFNPFTGEFMTDKYGKNKDKELKWLSFKKILITPNNDIVFNAEESYSTISNMTFGSDGVTLYHYDDIVSAKINTSGDIVWARNINKRQSSTDAEDYISYTSTIKGNNTYFFINTGEKVKKLSNDRIEFGQTNVKHSNFDVIRINENGDFDYQEILDDKDNEVPFMVANGETSGESVFFLGRKGKKKQILKVTL